MAMLQFLVNRVRIPPPPNQKKERKKEREKNPSMLTDRRRTLFILALESFQYSQVHAPIICKLAQISFKHH